jgi:4-carboxymuconolactone decarboxylase
VVMAPGPAASTVSIEPTVLPLVRLAAVVAAGSEEQMRVASTECVDASVPVTWVEELLLQSYLFCGFPRTLNAMREWRRASGIEAPVDRGGTDPDYAAWRAQGEATCAIVYGESYAKLRHNIERLHPELDQWMIVEGYGKILSRPGLDLRHRELCVVAACVASAQDRQLHSHLHGALNAGATAADVNATFDAIASVVSTDALTRARMLFQRVLGKG